MNSHQSVLVSVVLPVDGIHLEVDRTWIQVIIDMELVEIEIGVGHNYVA